MTPADIFRSVPVGITLESGRKFVAKHDGISEFASEEADANIFVQPTENGVRIVPLIQSGSANLTYKFDVPAGTTTLEIGKGRLELISPEGKPLGTVVAPQATDAAGNEMPTTYTWTGTTLEQSIAATDAAVYPLASPAFSWHYHLDYEVMNGGSLARGYDLQAGAMNLLYNCFNCYFPINGAPAVFPSLGQDITLNASPWTFINVPAPVSVDFIGPANFGFTALAGHFDGAGSQIFFAFFPTSSGMLHLVIDANVVKSNGAGVDGVNQYAAATSWVNFASRIATGLRTGGY